MRRSQPAAESDLRPEASGPLPVRSLRILCRKWAPFILAGLFRGPRRFGELARTHPAISRRVLSVELRRLARDGLVRRHELRRRPAAVEYRLAPRGVAFLRRLAPLARWEERVFARTPPPRGYLGIPT